MGDMLLLAAIPVGLAATALIVTANLPGPLRGVWVYAQLALMTGIYLGFAIAAIDPQALIMKPSLTVLALESLAALAFLVLGLAALQSRRLWLLGALVLAHGGVDLLHLVLETGYSLAWYAYQCAIYDAVLGAGVIWLFTGPAKTEDG